MRGLGTRSGNAPLKPPSILPLRRGFMSELDPALTLQALFIPNQSPGNPGLGHGPSTLSPSSSQIPQSRYSCGQGLCSAPGIWKLGGLEWPQILGALFKRVGGRCRGALNVTLLSHSAATSWLWCTKRGGPLGPGGAGENRRQT